MTAPFVGPESRAVDIASSFWTRMGDLPNPGWEVFLGPAQQARPDQLILTDRQGCPLSRSGILASALRRNTRWIHVGLADGSGRVFSTGRIGRRRSIARTVDAAQMVAGPLAVIAAQRDPITTDPATATAAPGGRLLVAEIAGNGWFARRLARAAVTYREWACAQIAVPSAASERLHVTSTWQTGNSRFWADPCVLAHEGRTWVFMEELDRATGRGHIVVAEVVGDQLRHPRTVHANDHHSSFPQVTWHEGRWLATVETCAGHNPVYEFDEVGSPWRPCAAFPPLPAHTADPVLDFEQGLLVGTDARTDGDSVLVNYRLDGQRWVPVTTATRVDVVWSRGGGTLDRARSIRAVQDCAGTYGVGLGWTDTSDPDVHLARWAASDLVDSSHWPRGIHTMSWDRDQTSVWIDGWRRRISPLGWRHRLTEQSHFRVCQG